MTSTPATAPRRFYAVAVAMGLAFATMAVGVPLHVAALAGQASATGSLLAAGTVAIAVGALAAGVLARSLRGGPRTLALALAVAAAGGVALSVSSSIVSLAAGVILIGAGNGVFWVGSQLTLSRRSGEPGSEHGFLLHYAAYTFGTVVGSALTGAIAGATAHAGLGTVTGIRLSYLLGALATLAGLATWRSRIAAEPGDVTLPRRPRGLASRDLAVQLPDLLLVGALGLLLPLAPVVLESGFHLSPLSIGLVMAGVALAKIAGTFAARSLTRTRGHRRTILTLLGSGATLCFLLSLAFTASLFIATLLATALAATGAWPLVVDAAQARVSPGRRQGLTVVWNAREYAVIAVVTAASGWLLAAAGSSTLLFALAASLLASAAASAAVVFRRPVWAPDATAVQPAA